MIPRSKIQEKDDMVVLNDQFVVQIDRVKHLENEKIRLAKKLELLLGREDHHTNVAHIERMLKINLEQKVDNLTHEKKKLQDQLERMQKEKKENQKRCDDEVNKKTGVESDTIIAKTELDKKATVLVKEALELEKLNRKLVFLRDAFDEEIMELESMIKNESVVISEKSKRTLDMDEVVKKVQAQYASLAIRDREEAEQRNQKKMDDMVLRAEQLEQEVHSIKIEISEVQRVIHTHKASLEELKRKEGALKDKIENDKEKGEDDIQKAQSEIKLLGDKLYKYEKDLAVQVKRHQELLKLKLALDFEIKTYQKLLEGEELRININKSDVHPPERKHLPERKHTPKMPQTAENTAVPMTSLTKETTVTPDTPVVPETTSDVSIHVATKNRLFIRLEVESEQVVSKSSQLTD